MEQQLEQVLEKLRSFEAEKTRQLELAFKDSLQWIRDRITLAKEIVERRSSEPHQCPLSERGISANKRPHKRRKENEGDDQPTRAKGRKRRARKTLETVEELSETQEDETNMPRTDMDYRHKSPSRSPVKLVEHTNLVSESYAGCMQRPTSDMSVQVDEEVREAANPSEDLHGDELESPRISATRSRPTPDDTAPQNDESTNGLTQELDNLPDCRSIENDEPAEASVRIEQEVPFGLEGMSDIKGGKLTVASDGLDKCVKGEEDNNDYGVTPIDEYKPREHKLHLENRITCEMPAEMTAEEAAKTQNEGSRSPGMYNLSASQTDAAQGALPNETFIVDQLSGDQELPSSPSAAVLLDEQTASSQLTLDLLQHRQSGELGTLDKQGIQSSSEHGAAPQESKRHDGLINPVICTEQNSQSAKESLQEGQKSPLTCQKKLELQHEHPSDAKPKAIGSSPRHASDEAVMPTLEQKARSPLGFDNRQDPETEFDGSSLKPTSSANLVTSFRSLVPEKGGALQMTAAVTKKAPQIDALRAAEVARKKEKAREAERQKQKEAIKQQKMERSRLALQAKGPAQKKGEFMKRRVENAKRKEDVPIKQRVVKSEAGEESRRDCYQQSTAAKKLSTEQPQVTISVEPEIGSTEQTKPTADESSMQVCAQDYPKSQIKGKSNARTSGIAAPVSIEIAPFRSDDESDGEEDTQPRPVWAQEPHLHKKLIEQQAMDPDDIFQQHARTCSLDEVFSNQRAGREPKRDLNRRTSTGNWLEDRVTWKEELQYKKAMGYL